MTGLGPVIHDNALAVRLSEIADVGDRVVGHAGCGIAGRCGQGKDRTSPLT
jgi:hypothetical protein